jgi:hypothetical protein
VLVSTVTTGTLNLSGSGVFTYDPLQNFCGSDTFTYYADDGVFTSATVAVTIDVLCINDLPQIDDEMVSIAEDMIT